MCLAGGNPAEAAAAVDGRGAAEMCFSVTRPMGGGPAAMESTGTAAAAGSGTEATPAEAAVAVDGRGAAELCFSAASPLLGGAEAA